MEWVGRRQDSRGRVQKGVMRGQLVEEVCVVTLALGLREALLEGVAVAVGALLHAHDLLLRRGPAACGGHHALHAAGTGILLGETTPPLTAPPGCSGAPHMCLYKSPHGFPFCRTSTPAPVQAAQHIPLTSSFPGPPCAEGCP